MSLCKRKEPVLSLQARPVLLPASLLQSFYRPFAFQQRSEGATCSNAGLRICMAMLSARKAEHSFDGLLIKDSPTKTKTKKNISIFSLDYPTLEEHNLSNRLSEEQFPPEGEGSAPLPEAIALVGRLAGPLQPNNHSDRPEIRETRTDRMFSFRRVNKTG